MQVTTFGRWAPVLPHWRVRALFASAESFLDREREALPLWWVVSVGGGIALWLILPGLRSWIAAMWLAAGLCLAGMALEGRTRRAVVGCALGLALGLTLVWWRAESVATIRLDRPVILTLTGTVGSIEPLPARDLVRLLIRPDDPSLPPLVRLNVDSKNVPAGLEGGAHLSVKARLTGPMQMPLPGAHDYARDFWFSGIGGMGKALGPVVLLSPAQEASGLDQWRARLDRHVRAQLNPSEGGIATALVTGDQGALPQSDADAMRRSGLAHLLSVSGLHIAAAIGATFFVALRLLSLSERLALRFNIVLIAAGAGALAGIGYTLLTGMQVPTVRSCLGALLVLAGTALGREAISLRMIATAALLILMLRPESLYGPSFQLSFAAVTTLVALFSWPWFKRFVEVREDGLSRRAIRHVAELLMTGLAIELALMPFALFHFHREGLYGVFANLLAIPLTTFAIMPLEAAALLFDVVGCGWPFWQATGWAISLLLWIAHAAAEAPGSVALRPQMPDWAFAVMVLGGLWLAIWREGRVRVAGVVPILAGAAAALSSPRPDLLVTGDGRHLAIVAEDGTPFLLRERAKDYIRGLLGETAAFDGELPALDDWPAARCSLDSCIAILDRGERRWTVLAVRSGQKLEWNELTAACTNADIVIADRRLPQACHARSLRLDARELARTGGLTIKLGVEPELSTVASEIAGHPWSASP